LNSFVRPEALRIASSLAIHSPLARRNKSDLEAAVQHWRRIEAKVNVQTVAAKTACWRKQA
jgi:hypothetical protein